MTTFVDLLGVRIDRIRWSTLLERAIRSAQLHTRLTVLYVNVHSMNVQHHNAVHRGILADADIVYCDGMGVRLGARLTEQDIPERMTGADWIHPLCESARRHDLSIYLLGATLDVVRAAAGRLTEQYPGLRIAGARHGYSAGPDVVAEINAARPDILLVGMGTPLQETWIAQYRAQLDVPVVWAVGGLFDFVSGRTARGPHWMTQNGLEWLCRLVVEPRRLWRRYLLGNPRFLCRILFYRARSVSRITVTSSTSFKRSRPAGGM